MTPEDNNNGFVSVGVGNRHPTGPTDFVMDISTSSWAVTDKIDTTCFKLATASQSESVTVDGVAGVRKTGTLIECQGGQRQDVVEYDFTANGRNYLFSYALRTGAVPLSDFDLMVRNTASFSG